MARNTQKIIVEIKKEYYDYLKKNFGYYGGIRAAVDKAIKSFIEEREQIAMGNLEEEEKNDLP